MPADDDRYFAEVAKHFFNQFLEMKVLIDQGKIDKPRNWDKEMEGYKKANAALKKSCQDLAERNAQLEEELATAEEKAEGLHGQLNEALINLGRLQQKIGDLGIIRQEVERQGYPFVELMSEESRRQWESMMKEVPYRGPRNA